MPQTTLTGYTDETPPEEATEDDKGEDEDTGYTITDVTVTDHTGGKIVIEFRRDGKRERLTIRMGYAQRRSAGEIGSTVNSKLWIENERDLDEYGELAPTYPKSMYETLDDALDLLGPVLSHEDVPADVEQTGRELLETGFERDIV